jgi:hypothetical protein
MVDFKWIRSQGHESHKTELKEHHRNKNSVVSKSCGSSRGSSRQERQRDQIWQPSVFL